MPTAESLGVEDVEEVLREVFHIEGQDTGNGEFRFLCLVHEDSRPSCDCNLESGLWSCFSCQASGDLIDLGVAAIYGPEAIPREQAKTRAQRMERKAQRDRIEKLIAPKSLDGKLAAARRRLRANKQLSETLPKQRKRIRVAPLGSYNKGPLDELLDRDFTKKQLKKWNVRFTPELELLNSRGEPFTIKNNLAIPIVRPDGEVASWCYRATKDSDSWQPRYIYSNATELSEIWGGLDHLTNADEVTVTEGLLDAIYLDQFGYQSLAILGSNVKSQRKIRTLLGFRSVVLFPDRDTAGALWAMKLGSTLLEHGVGVSVCRLASWMRSRQGKQAKDANDLCQLDLELARERGVPFLYWRQQVM